MRTRLKLTQGVLGESLGISDRQVCAWEREKARPEFGNGKARSRGAYKDRLQKLLVPKHCDFKQAEAILAFVFEDSPPSTIASAGMDPPPTSAKEEPKKEKGPATPEESPNRSQVQDSIEAKVYPPHDLRLPGAEELKDAIDSLRSLTYKNCDPYALANFQGLPDPRYDESRASHHLRELDASVRQEAVWEEEFENGAGREEAIPSLRPAAKDLLRMIGQADQYYARYSRDFVALFAAFDKGKALLLRCGAIIQCGAEHFARPSQRKAALRMARNAIQQLDECLRQAWLEGRTLRAELGQIEEFRESWVDQLPSSSLNLGVISVDEGPDLVWPLVEMLPFLGHGQFHENDLEELVWSTRCIAAGACPDCGRSMVECNEKGRASA